MLADTLVRVVTGQGYVSLYAHGLHEDQDCQSSVSCEGSPLGFEVQMNIPNYSCTALISKLLAQSPGFLAEGLSCLKLYPQQPEIHHH